MARPLLQIVEANTAGRDFVVGDIHGCFYLVEALLAHVEFDEKTDRLFSLGDLIDHGPESERISEFLLQPWFHAIRGNHEWMLLRGAHTVEQAPLDMAAAQQWLSNAGSWFFQMPIPDQEAVYFDISRLPVLLEIEDTEGTSHGLIHGDVIADDWLVTRDSIQPTDPDPDFVQSLEHVLWSRERYGRLMSSDGGESNSIGVANIDVVWFGHTPLPRPARSANTRWLDTGAAKDGTLSIAELATDGQVWSIAEDCLTVTTGWSQR